jgi:hypothetical protein
MIGYLKGNVISSKVGSINGNGRAVGSPSGGICGVVPYYSCIEISLTLKYQICFVGLHHHFFPANNIW